MDRKFTIFILILLLLAVIGVFWWWTAKEKESEEGKSVWKIELVREGYEVIETSEGKFLENKKYGLEVKVPEGWIVKDYGTEIDLLSPETEFDEYGGVSMESIREKGACGVSVEIIKCEKVDPEIETDAEEIEFLISETQKNPAQMEEKGYELIEIGDHLALKKVSAKGKRISVNIVISNIVYSFDTYVFFEKCSQEFDKVLQTVEIRK